MAKTYYPTALDLLHFLEIGVSTVPDAVKRFLEDQVIAARQDLEGGQGCGRIFLAGASETRRFDPPDNDQATLFVPDVCVVTSIVYYPEGGTSETLVLNTDYWLEPSDAAAKGEPWTSIDFERFVPVQPRGANRRSIRITGRFGYATTLPENVWLAILARAAWKLWQQQRAGTTGGILSWKDGERSVEYGVAPTQDLVANWASQYDSVVGQYRRLSF